MCVDMLQQHVTRKKFKAGVLLMGHTSSDPTVDLAPDATRKRKVWAVALLPKQPTYCCDWRAGCTAGRSGS